MKSANRFDYCNEILLCIQKSPKSVKEISAETKIQITSVYRMIQLLENHELVMVIGRPSQRSADQSSILWVGIFYSSNHQRSMLWIT